VYNVMRGLFFDGIRSIGIRLVLRVQHCFGVGSKGRTDYNNIFYFDQHLWPRAISPLFFLFLCFMPLFSLLDHDL